jgi:hypothetical protein
MANWLKRLFNKQEIPTKVSTWETADSIFIYLAAHVGPDGKLAESASTLPDEKPDETDNAIRFAPGLMDAMFGEDGSDDAARNAKELARLLGSVSTNGSRESAAAFYTMVTESESVIGIIDEFLQSVVDRRLLDHCVS